MHADWLPIQDSLSLSEATFQTLSLLLLATFKLTMALVWSNVIVTAKHKRKRGVCHFTSEEVEVRVVISVYSMFDQRTGPEEKDRYSRGALVPETNSGAAYNLYISPGLYKTKSVLPYGARNLAPWMWALRLYTARSQLWWGQGHRLQRRWNVRMLMEEEKL